MAMTDRAGFVIKAGLFSGMAAVTVAAFLVEAQLAISDVGNTSFSLTAAVLGYVQIWLFASPLAGGFGTVCGAVGALLLSFQVGRIRSLASLLGESVLLGTLLSLSAPLLHRTLQWSGGGQGEMLLFRNHLLLLSVAVGAITSMLFAVFFKQTLLSAD